MKAEREVESMACRLVATLPEGEEWLYEIKWDGYRAIGTKHAAAPCNPAGVNHSPDPFHG